MPPDIEPGVRLPDGLERLAATVAQVAPRLLILDPLIRLHRADENSATDMAVVLDGLRGLARASECAILLVHHTRKAPAGGVAGHSLRGSSDLHAFGDTNLYLRRLGPDAALELRIEHRAAPCPPPLRLQLRVEDTGTGPVARFVCDDVLPPDPLRCARARPARDGTPLERGPPDDPRRAQANAAGRAPAPRRHRPHSSRRARWLDCRRPDGSGSGLYGWERERAGRVITPGPHHERHERGVSPRASASERSGPSGVVHRPRLHQH